MHEMRKLGDDHLLRESNAILHYAQKRCQAQDAWHEVRDQESETVKIASHVVAGSEGRGSATPTLGSEL